VASGTGEPSRLSPATVAVHDQGDMPGELFLIQRGKKALPRISKRRNGYPISGGV
jgi:hypothetical protein